jgi:DNA end-binding protein Ku
MIGNDVPADRTPWSNRAEASGKRPPATARNDPPAARLTPLADSRSGQLETGFPGGIVPWSSVAFSEYAMAPRANWKGFLRLSLVTCPVALYPATSDTDKVSFNQINRKTGHRIKYAKVDAETGEEVAAEDIMKGYKIDTDTYVEVSKEELDDVALESTRTIEIDEFVPKSDIDGRYLIRPYYLVPDGKVGHDAFAVIRETIRSMNKVAIGRVVLTNREHIIALEPLEKGLMGTLLRYPYEVRSEKEYFDDIQDVKVTKDMLDLAKHIVEKKSGSFEPDRFEDRYESALVDLINQKRNGLRTTAKAAPKSGGNVINLMDALKRSLASEKQAAPQPKIRKPRKRIEGQREMLLPISGKRAAKEDAKAPEQRKAAKPVRTPARSKKAG